VHCRPGTGRASPDIAHAAREKQGRSTVIRSYPSAGALDLSLSLALVCLSETPTYASFSPLLCLDSISLFQTCCLHPRQAIC
jgi:hypothetical protein